MSTDKICPNCAATLHGSFCSNCGQNQKSTNRFLLALINEAFEDIFRIDSRAWRTTSALLFKPGFLSTEYFAGRRARYVPPLRLYVITSLAFFVSLSVMTFFSEPARVVVNGDNTASEQSTTHESTVPESTPQESTIQESTTQESTTQESNAAAEEAPEATPDDVALQDLELENLSLPFIDEAQTEQLREVLKRQSVKLKQMLEEDPMEFGAILIDLAPPIIFLLLPIFALLLKFAYLFTGRFYTEHLVVAVHNQCFLYSVLLIYSTLPLVLGVSWSSLPQALIAIWIPLYMLLSLKRVYQQSWPFTTLKYFVLSISYALLLFSGMAIASLVGFLTL